MIHRCGYSSYYWSWTRAAWSQEVSPQMKIKVCSGRYRSWYRIGFGNEEVPELLPNHYVPVCKRFKELRYTRFLG